MFTDVPEINTEGAIKSGQSTETGNIWYTRRRQTKPTHNKTNTNNAHKTRAPLQTRHDPPYKQDISPPTNKT